MRSASSFANPRLALHSIGGDRRAGVDELRDVDAPFLHALAIEALELGRREGMRRGTGEERVRPGLQPRKLLDLADALDAVEEVIALQEGRVSGIHQRIRL